MCTVAEHRKADRVNSKRNSSSSQPVILAVAFRCVENLFGFEAQQLGIVDKEVLVIEMVHCRVPQVRQV